MTPSINLFDNPILRRELLERLRSMKMVAAMLAVAALTSIVVLLRWPTIVKIALESGVASGAPSQSQLLTQGTMDIFRPLAFGLAATIAALVPAFPATSIVRERQRGTLAMLLHSPLAAWQIYLGKLLANCMIAWILIAASLPAMAGCYLLGGLSLESHVLPLYIVLCVMVVVFSAIGLWISSVSQSIDASLRITYGAVLGTCVLTLIPSLLWTQSTGSTGAIVRLIRASSPLTAIQEIVGQSAVGGEGLLSSQGWLLPYLGMSCGIIGVAIVATLYRLRPNALERARSSGIMTEDRSLGSRVVRRFAFLIDPQRRKKGIPFYLNPVMVKEFRTRRFGRIHWLIRLVSACAIASLGLTVITATGTVAWGPERIVGAMVVLQLALLLLLGPSLGAGLISTEVESGGWVQLRMTPMSPLKIVRGKLLSVFWTLGLILLATMPGYIAMAYIQPPLAAQLGNVSISLFVTAILILAISGTISSFQKNTAMATATSYAVLLTLLAGSFLVWAARDKPFGRDFVERTLLLNPAAAALSEMRIPGFESYELLPASWWISLGITALCFLLLGWRTWKISRPS